MGSSSICEWQTFSTNKTKIVEIIKISTAFENLELSIYPMSNNVKIWTLDYAYSFQNGIKPNAKLFQLIEVEYKCNIQTFYHSLFSFIKPYC